MFLQTLNTASIELVTRSSNLQNVSTVRNIFPSHEISCLFDYQWTRSIILRMSFRRTVINVKID